MDGGASVTPAPPLSSTDGFKKSVSQGTRAIAAVGARSAPTFAGGHGEILM
jgi:hypothetical protein